MKANCLFWFNFADHLFGKFLRSEFFITQSSMSSEWTCKGLELQWTATSTAAEILQRLLGLIRYKAAETRSDGSTWWLERTPRTCYLYYSWKRKIKTLANLKACCHPKDRNITWGLLAVLHCGSRWFVIVIARAFRWFHGSVEDFMGWTI